MEIRNNKSSNPPTYATCAGLISNIQRHNIIVALPEEGNGIRGALKIRSFKIRKLIFILITVF